MTTTPTDTHPPPVVGSNRPDLPLERGGIMRSA